MSMNLMVAAMATKVGNPLRKLVLIKLADNANDLGECWPSYQHIADQCEISKRSVITHIKALEKDGLLTIHRRKISEIRNQSNVFILTLGGAGDSLGGAGDSPPPGAGAAPRTSHSLEPVKEPTAPRKRGAILLKTFLEECEQEGREAIPPDDPVFSLAKRNNIPTDYILINWMEFKERNLETGKKYKNWPQAFRNSVRDRWYKLWWFDSGECKLTNDGLQAAKARGFNV